MSRLSARRAQRRTTASPTALLHNSEEMAPEISLINLVDLMLVFAVGLLLALVNHTASTSPSASAKPVSPQRMKLVGEPQNGPGTRVGTAYQLPNGEIIYVPDR